MSKAGALFESGAITWMFVARGEARPAYRRAFAAQLAVFKGATEAS